MCRSATESGFFTGIRVHESNPYYCAVDGVLFDATMDNLLFYPSAKPDKVYTTPDTITRINRGAFDLANNLIHLKISDSVSKIDECAFYCMRELERIELSSSLSVLEAGLFWGCIKLEDISFPDTITTIEMGVFNETAIYAIHIPPNVTRIEEKTFTSCENLQDVYCGENITYIEEFAFDRLSSEPLTFHVYKGSYAERYAIAHDYHIVYR